eukprot:g14095.t1
MGRFGFLLSHCAQIERGKLGRAAAALVVALLGSGSLPSAGPGTWTLPGSTLAPVLIGGLDRGEVLKQWAQAVREEKEADFFLSRRTSAATTSSAGGVELLEVDRKFFQNPRMETARNVLAGEVLKVVEGYDGYVVKEGINLFSWTLFCWWQSCSSSRGWSGMMWAVGRWSVFTCSWSHI